MLPTWLNEKLGLLWHEYGQWNEIGQRNENGQWNEIGQRNENGQWNEIGLNGALYGSNGAVWTANVGEVHIEVKLDWEKSEDEAGRDSRKVASVEVSVSPGSTGTAKLSGLQVMFTNDSELECVWKPHLAPLEGMVVGDKMFRSPAIVFEGETKMTALIPDLDSIQRDRALPHMMDYTVYDRKLMYGLCDYAETGHVYHELKPSAIVFSGQLSFRFYLVEWEKESGQRSKDYRLVEKFLWERFAARRMPVPDAGSAGNGGETGNARDARDAGDAGDAGNEGVADILAGLEPYANHAYEWALNRWKDVTWQQFKLEDGTEVGGVVFIVCAWQKPGFGREEEWREPKSLWNQAWFCGLRTAYGYGWWGREQGRTDWIEKAELALNFALAAPQTDGLFPGYYQAGEGNAWETGKWFMSGPRRPAGHEAHVHLLDSSWTCWWLLKWYRDVKQDERIVPFVKRYAERLLTLQREDGAFPAWIRLDGSGISPFLTQSPESAMHVMLLCLLHRIVPDARYVTAAIRAASFVAERIVPEGRWEDFETYWSCSRQWDGKQFGEKDARSGLYNQCNFGIYWTAEAYKDLYAVTEDREWLDLGEQVLAEASLYQQIWQPSFFPVPTIGGFGVMNSDDEWNDARQSLFALTYWDYYSLTGNESYRARAIWAMKASFYMMYCPENEGVKEIYERVHPHFDETDYGFHMENFNHHDGTPVDGLGEFTIFDWGCGAAAASLAEFKLKGRARR
ncbi:hypothetical protein [Cohnella herbarum]|uniref:Uncharacterized protein n=1 Tax=Cohnella herbarum TaxID=2728023 RepID=A0A7Z2VQ96_9BACL|nr:hypothetical protein [Cohnella herbarum]QJD87134.1 hypothetical protein HH215_30795 [Cohnella herbarum]